MSALVPRLGERAVAVMAIIRAQGPISASGVAAAAGCSLGAVRPRLSELCFMGLIAPTQGPGGAFRAVTRREFAEAANLLRELLG